MLASVRRGQAAGRGRSPRWPSRIRRWRRGPDWPARHWPSWRTSTPPWNDARWNAIVVQVRSLRAHGVRTEAERLMASHGLDEEDLDGWTAGAT